MLILPVDIYKQIRIKNKTPNLHKPFQIPFPHHSHHPFGDPESTQKTKTKRKSNYQISLIKSQILQFFSSTQHGTILYSASEKP
jgi:hypothetical protein